MQSVRIQKVLSMLCFR